MVGCILALWPAIGIGGQGARKDAYEVGTANATRMAGHVGDTLRLDGTGMLPNADLVVLFGVRIDNVNYIAYVGDAVSDAGGNWSLNVPIPATVQAYNIVTVAGMGMMRGARPPFPGNRGWERSPAPWEYR